MDETIHAGAIWHARCSDVEVMRSLFAIVMILVVGCGSQGAGTVDAGGDDVDAGVDADTGDPCLGGTLCGAPVTCCAAGNECVEDRCLAACSSGVRCGATLDTCCGSGQVCISDTCATPGATCSDPYDCDPGLFCEPSLNQCLPQPLVADETGQRPVLGA